MLSEQVQFITDTAGTRVGVLLDIAEYNRLRLIQKNNYPNISSFSGVACGHTEYFNLWKSKQRRIRGFSTHSISFS